MGIFVAFCMLASAELVLRLVHGPTIAPISVHSSTTKRSQNGQDETWFYENMGQIRNSYQHQPVGYFRPTSNVPRFAVFGGSSVRGGTNNIDHRDEFTALAANISGIHGVNLGNPAVDSHDLLRILLEFKQYPFDAWVIYTGHNDFGNTYFYQRYQGWTGGVLAHLQGGLERLQLYWQLRRIIGFPSGNTSSPNPDPSKQFSGPKIDQNQKDRALRYYEMNINRIIYEARKANIPLIFVVPVRSLFINPVGGCIENEPCSASLYLEAQELLTSDPTKAVSLLRQAADHDTVPLRILSDAQDFIRSKSDEEGVWVIDAPALFAKDERADFPASQLFQDHVHLSAKGHQQMAAILAPVLKEVINR